MRENKPYVFLKTFLTTKCFKLDDCDLKIGYININGLRNAQHAEYLNADKNLLNLNLMIVSDTRLSKNDSAELLEEILSNWVIVHQFDCTDKKKHMGILAMTPKSLFLNWGSHGFTKRNLKKRGEGIESKCIRPPPRLC